MTPDKSFSWFRTRPATKAAWFGGIIALIALIVNSYIVWQNSNAIDTTRDAVLLSMEPSIEVRFRSDSAFISSTTSVPLKDIQLLSITYLIKPEPFKVLSRIATSGYFRLADDLLPKQSIGIPFAQLVNWDEDICDPKACNPNVIRVAVITFRRQVDLKRFATIEIYYAFNIRGEPALSSLFSGRGSAMSGPPSHVLKILTEVERTERAFLKMHDFQ